MKPKIILSLIAIAVIVLLWSIHHVRSTRDRNLRQAQYRAVVDAYSEQIKIGMNRSDAEDVIHEKAIPFTRTSIQGSGQDDLITIGHEKPPASCRFDDVYIRVSFTSSTGALATASPTDKVQHVDLFEWPRSCA